eukprot:5459557-Prymnesium_polylepis.1
MSSDRSSTESLFQPLVDKVRHSPPRPGGNLALPPARAPSVLRVQVSQASLPDQRALPLHSPRFPPPASAAWRRAQGRAPRALL